MDCPLCQMCAKPMIYWTKRTNRCGGTFNVFLCVPCGQTIKKVLKKGKCHA